MIEIEKGYIILKVSYENIQICIDKITAKMAESYELNFKENVIRSKLFG